MKDGTYIVRIDGEGIPRLSEPVVMTSGYWVSTEGVSIHGELDQAGIIDALDLMELHEGAIVGLWENEGLTYVDKSIHINNKTQALAAAEVFNQIAIYDCNKGEVVEV